MIKGENIGRGACGPTLGRFPTSLRSIIGNGAGLLDNCRVLPLLPSFLSIGSFIPKNKHSFRFPAGCAPLPRWFVASSCFSHTLSLLLIACRLLALKVHSLANELFLRQCKVCSINIYCLELALKLTKLGRCDR